MKEFLNIVYLIVGASTCFFLYLLMSSTQNDSTNSQEFCGTASTFISCGTSSFPEYGNPKEGKTLFRNQCAPCHAKDMKSDMTGPALSGSMRRWSSDTLALQVYFKDSPSFLDTTSNERLVELREKWRPTVSHKFDFSLQEIKDIMCYVEGW